MGYSKLKKNILDLNYNKNLQYLNTSIIISFTYIITVLIAVFTKQLVINKAIHSLILIVFSALFFIIILMLIAKFKQNMENIENEINNLKP